MFYLSGIATQEALLKLNIEHELIMQKKKVFAKYHINNSFRESLTNYYNSKIDLNELAVQLLQTPGL